TYAVDDARFEVVAGRLKLVDGASLPLGTSVPVLVTTTDSGGFSYAETFTVTAVPPGSGAGNGSAVSFLQFGPGATGAAPIDVGTAQCDAGAGYQDLAALTRFDGTPIAVPATLSLLPADVFKSGAAIFMQVIDPDANADPLAIEAVQVTVSTAAGDAEQLRFFETAADSGVFVGYAQSASAAVTVGDCVIDTVSMITVTYIDAMDATDTSAANVLVDPEGLVFFSGTGQPVSGAEITLVDAATGLPATVFGDSGLDAFPASVTSGGSTVDAGGTAYDFADGAFRFPFVAAGDYVLLVDPPNRFVFPSAVADPALQLLPGAPFALGPGSRGNAFAVPVGPAVRVDIPLDVAPIVPTASTLELLSLSPGNPGASFETVQASACWSGGGFAPAPPPTDQRGSTTAVPAVLELAPAQRFGSGDAIYLRLTDLDQDLDPFAADVVVVDVSVPGQNDAERVQLTETAASTGVFVGHLQTSAATVAANDCRLGAEPGSTVEFSYEDAVDSADTAFVTALLDPGFTVFSSLTGALVDDVQITLVDATTGLPATAAVFSADGITPFPTTVVSGGSVTDAAGNTIDFAAGSFRFPIIRPGNYRFEAVTPAGVAFPSTVPDADLAALSGGPFVIVAGSRGFDFEVLAGVPATFDVPVDPTSADVFLSKQASKDIAAIGDFVQYQVLVQNAPQSSSVSDLVVTDVLPKGFRYVPDSARIDGAAVADPSIGADGRSLFFGPLALSPGARIELRYVTEITVGAELGRARNEATAAGSGVANVNVAFAEVTVREDLLRDKAIVVGRVLDGDCESPADMTGMADVRIFLEDGTYVVTDPEGKYHFEGLEPGSHVVQLDVGSLPQSHAIAHCDESSRFAGSSYSQFIDLQGGTLWQADFYVARKPDQVTEFSGRLVSEADDGRIRYQYQIAGGALAVSNVTSVVMLPDSLSYLAGSASVDGRPTPDPKGAEQGALQFKLPHLEATGGALAAGFTSVIAFETAVLDPRDEIVVKAITMLKSPSGKHRIPVATNEISVNWPSSLVTIAATRAHFAEAQSRVPAEEEAKLAAIRQELDGHGGTDLRVRVVGHADSKPLKARTRIQYANNQALSEARAANVAEMVRKQLQLSEDRVVVEARGAEDPLADNTTYDGRAANRRVEIEVVGEVFEPTRGTQRSDSGAALMEVTVDQA
ncbi:MAG: OmpA family protein, partial [Gammaproteobacteria bacterium]|nr:OmpA family protein [Gammaproteobacteria bacterium]